VWTSRHWGKLSAVAKKGLRFGGAVQHGASTLPKAFNEFAKADAIEGSSRDRFQNLVFDHPALPRRSRSRSTPGLRENRQEERKEGMTDEQFYTPPASAASARRGSRRRGGTCPRDQACAS